MLLLVVEPSIVVQCDDEIAPQQMQSEVLDEEIRAFIEARLKLLDWKKMNLHVIQRNCFIEIGRFGSCEVIASCNAKIQGHTM